MALISNILQITGLYPDVYQTSGNSWLGIAGAVLGGIVSGGSLIYFVFFRQFKLKHQSEAEKTKHEADQEKANAKLHEEKVLREIRTRNIDELNVAFRQTGVLRNELTQANEKAYKAKAETYYYKHLMIKLEADLAQIKERFKAGYCANMNCPNRINNFDETKI